MPVVIVFECFGVFAYLISNQNFSKSTDSLMAVPSVIPSVGTALVWVPMVAYLFLSGQTTAAIGVGLWCAVVVGSSDNVLQHLEVSLLLVHRYSHWTHSWGLVYDDLEIICFDF
jgi:predicted PurR-regulated permease PerM